MTNMQDGVKNKEKRFTGMVYCDITLISDY